MDWFHLRIVSIPYLTQVVLGLVITLYFFSKKERSQTVRLLTAFYAAFTLRVLFQFLAHSLTAGWAFIFTASYPVLFLLELTPLILFAYAFLGNPYPREERVVRVVALSLIAGTILYVGYQVVTYGPHHHIPFGRFVLLSVVMLVWSLGVFVRKTIHFSGVAGASVGVLEKPALRDGPGWFMGGIHNVIKPEGREAVAQRAFFLAVVLWVLVGMIGSLSFIGLVPDQVVLMLSLIGMLAFLSGFVLVYINYGQDPTTFQVKLVGLALVTMLAALGLVSLGGYSAAELLRDSQTLPPGKGGVRFTPDAAGGYAVAVQPLSLDADVGGRLPLGDDDSALLNLGFGFPFYGVRHEALYVNANGLVSFGSPMKLDVNLLHRSSFTFQRDFYDAVPKAAP